MRNSKPKAARSFAPRRSREQAGKDERNWPPFSNFSGPATNWWSAGWTASDATLRDVLNLIHECDGKGAFVTVLDPHVSTRGEMGHVVSTVLGMVAQMERRFIKER